MLSTDPSQTINGGIYWLASYPKSGNTWVRSFIYALLNKSPEQELDINALDTGDIASSRPWLEDGLGFDIDQLSHAEVDYLRPFAYTWLAKQMTDLAYHKVHDAYTYLPDGSPLFPSTSLGVLYIVRNPLDVVVSYANHSGQSIDKCIEYLGDSTHSYARSKVALKVQVRQKLTSWSEHVTSWRSSGLNQFVVRYEDMQSMPQHTFRQISEFLHLPSEANLIANALEKCRFDNLKTQEREKGFTEKPVAAISFFRKGIVGDWKTTLTQQQVARIISDHGEVMESLGYIENGQPALQQC